VSKSENRSNLPTPAQNTAPVSTTDYSSAPRRISFAEDFRRFFLRGLAAVLPTLITLWVLLWIWDSLWKDIGVYIIYFIRIAWDYGIGRGWLPFQTRHYILMQLDYDSFGTRALGVGLAIILVYSVGVFVSKIIGRAFWRAAEHAVLRIPFVRAIYPVVKQVTDFVLADRTHQFEGSRVVAVQPHEQNIWSIGLVTGSRPWNLGDGPEEMVTVFIPSTPTSFSGYVLVVPRSKVVELPMTVEEAFRLLVSGGVIMPPDGSKTLGQPAAEAPDSNIVMPVSPQLEKTA
jgi:uncharacterized membrane protein